MQGPASRQYKEVVAALTAAAEAQRERDRERAAELSRQLVELDQALTRADERAARTRRGVDVQWKAALEALWMESWLKLRPRPEPDPAAEPADLDDLDAEVKTRSEALREAVRGRRFGLPGR